MAAKPKTRSARPKAKAQSKSDKEQSERFIKTARGLGVNETIEAFESVFSKVIPSKVARKKQRLE